MPTHDFADRSAALPARVAASLAKAASGERILWVGYPSRGAVVRRNSLALATTIVVLALSVAAFVHAVWFDRAAPHAGTTPGLVALVFAIASAYILIRLLTEFLLPGRSFFAVTETHVVLSNASLGQARIEKIPTSRILSISTTAAGPAHHTIEIDLGNTPDSYGKPTRDFRTLIGVADAEAFERALRQAIGGRAAYISPGPPTVHLPTSNPAVPEDLKRDVGYAAAGETVLWFGQPARGAIADKRRVELWFCAFFLLVPLLMLILGPSAKNDTKLHFGAYNIPLGKVFLSSFVLFAVKMMWQPLIDILRAHRSFYAVTNAHVIIAHARFGATRIEKIERARIVSTSVAAAPHGRHTVTLDLGSQTSSDGIQPNSRTLLSVSDIAGCMRAIGRQ